MVENKIEVTMVTEDDNSQYIMYAGKRYTRSNNHTLTIDLRNYDNIYEAFKKDKKGVAEVIKFLLDSYNALLVNDPVNKVHEDLTTHKLLFAVYKMLVDAKGIDAGLYDALGYDLHPISMIKSGRWNSYMGVPKGKISPEDVAAALIGRLKMMRFCSQKEFMENLDRHTMGIYHELTTPQVMNLPHYPALKYQAETLGKAAVGTQLSGTGFIYGGQYEEGVEDCPACHTAKLFDYDKYKVCPVCHLGLE